MTAAWSKGCRQSYAYYRCVTRGCEAKRKSGPRSKMEDGFAEILQSLSPSRQLLDLVTVMLRDAWDMRLAQAHEQQGAWKAQFKATEKQIDDLLDRVMEAGSQSVIRAYEKRIDGLERQKIILAEKASKTLPPKGRLEECIELTLKFLANPWNI